MSELHDRAREVALRLKRAGHETYFAGGCVRDRLLGREPLDYDIATAARPEEVQALFRRTVGVGKQFGVVVVLSGSCSFDVATFRADGAYGDGRRPDEIRFTSAEEDVRRRDFTINGLLMDPEDGRIVDHVGGRADLEAGVVRTIGEPRERFGEDRLRILRAVRFASRLDFELESGTAAALRELAPFAADPSPERVLGELERTWTENDAARGLRMLEELELLPVVLPEVAAKSDLRLPRRLIGGGAETDDALERLRRLLVVLGRGPRPAGLVWALVLDDLVEGPPNARARAAAATLERLRASGERRDEVALLLRCRDRLLFASSPSRTRLSLLSAHPRLGLVERFAGIERRVADPASLGPEVSPVAAALPAPLLRGDELFALGVPRGPAVGRVMRRLRFLQLEGRLESAEAARAWIRSRAAR